MPPQLNRKSEDHIHNSDIYSKLHQNLLGSFRRRIKTLSILITLAAFHYQSYKLQKGICRKFKKIFATLLLTVDMMSNI